MKFGLIGVPSSAGAHGPGQEKAPSALRTAGLLGALREAGLDVEDLGDLPLARFAPDRPTHDGPQTVPSRREPRWMLTAIPRTRPFGLSCYRN